MTHTPGPWAVGPHPGNLAGIDWRTIVTNHGGHFDAAYVGEALLSDALLIAAAPELLDMCERLLGFALHHGDPTAVEAGHGMLEAARELLAKARGTAQ
jgi:hypothetical protein